MKDNQLVLKDGWNLVALRNYTVSDILNISNNKIACIYRFDQYYIDIINDVTYTFLDKEGYWIKAKDKIIIPSYNLYNLVLTGNYILLESYNHDKDAFTQGFEFNNNKLYESTGLYGSSSLREINLDGNIIQQINLNNQYFAEGITIWGNKIIQLTWQNGVVFVYNLNSFNLLEELPIDTTNGQGWGITHSHEYLIISDGTSYLHFCNPDTLKTIYKIQVLDNNIPITNLNELEYINGLIFCNVWLQSKIICVNSNNGNVIMTFNMNQFPLPEDIYGNENVLNGIAVNDMENELYITGKKWNKIYKIKFI